MWHTHQLWMYGYFKDCLSSSCHAVIDHDDKVEAGELDDGFLFASRNIRKGIMKTIQSAIAVIARATDQK